MAADLLSGTASAMARAVAGGECSAVQLLDAALTAIDSGNQTLRCFTDLTLERARTEAAAVDAARSAGRPLGPLAGVPYGVKNLFDLAGVVTRAGSLINRDNPAARSDAFAVSQLVAAGAVCVGAQNMGEYAYDFTGENAHDGDCRNPHDLAHMAGGSSSGPAAAVAAAMVPFSLGTDTNGSIRVPSSYCGLFGLKPSFGRLSRRGAFPFCASLDHIGPLARSVEDLTLIYNALLGADPLDPAQDARPASAIDFASLADEPPLRIAVAGGYFRERCDPVALQAVDAMARSLSVSEQCELPQAARARAAAFVITASEAAGLHLTRLRERAADFDPMMRDRLLAGAMAPVSWVMQAQRFRRWYQLRLAELFRHFDVILAPATPTTALAIGQQTVQLDGESVPARQAIGPFTQPISFAGLPVVTVPYWPAGSGLPIGVQVIAAPWREDHALQVAQQLQQSGVSRVRIAKPYSLSGSSDA